MLNKLKTQREGFTIIEVIIVLVIGAVIMLAVFLVVPQLQRSARNTRQADIARQYLTAAQQVKANNGGTAPTQAQIAQQTGTLKNGTQQVNVAVEGTPSRTNAVVYADKKCNGNVVGDSNPGGFAVVIGTETGGNDSTICVSS